MPYPNRESALAFVAASCGFPVCGGCGVVLAPTAGRGGPARRWCSAACRSYARRRRYPFELRQRPVDELEAESVVALQVWRGDRDTARATTAVHVLTLAGA